MKANQKFANADEAVSPVIGVILMVAITVVLAAVVFVLVSDLGGDSKSAPAVSFNLDEQDDRISLTKAPTGLSWDDFEFRTSAVVEWSLNAEGDTEGGATNPTVANTYYPVGLAANTVAAGDFIDICDDVNSGNQIEITVRHVDSNQVVYSGTFSSVVSCTIP